jgi:hypothetical protein
MAIGPVDPVPRLTPEGFNAYSWQRWFLSMQQKVNSLITANSVVGTFEEITSSSTALVSGTIANICTLSLGAGEWDVEGTVQFIPGPSCQYSDLIFGVSQVPTAFGAVPGSRSRIRQSTNTIGVAQSNQEFPTPTVRLNLAVAGQVHLVVQAAFTTDTLSVAGYLRARSF